MLSFFAPSPGYFSILTSVLMGAAFFMLFGIVTYAMQRGKRDFTSTSQVVATNYDVVVSRRGSPRSPAPAAAAADDTVRCGCRPQAPCAGRLLQPAVPAARPTTRAAAGPSAGPAGSPPCGPQAGTIRTASRVPARRAPRLQPRSPAAWPARRKPGAAGSGTRGSGPLPRPAGRPAAVRRPCQRQPCTRPRRQQCSSG